MSKRPRVVVVGNGYGATCQIPALVWAGQADVVAVVGQQADKARATAERFHIPLGTTSLTDALATSPDLVLVSTPPATHLPIVREVVERTQAAVLCEKPVAHTLDDARAIAALLADRAAWVDHQLRWSPPRLALRALIQSGALGEVRHARIEMTMGSAERMRRGFTWWDERDKGGGALLAIGSHLVDALGWLLGPVVDVRARLHRFVRERVSDGEGREVTSDDGAELWLTHASGATSTMVTSTSRLLGGRTLLEIDGTKGFARLDESSDAGRVEVLFMDGTQRTLDARLPTIAEVDACNPSAFARCEPLFLRDVVDAVAHGARALPNAATLADGVRTQEVLERALAPSTTA